MSSPVPSGSESTIPAHYDTRRGIRRWFGFGNFEFGDCTVAAIFHLIMVHAVSAASTWKKLLYDVGFRPPHDAFVVEEYTKYLATLNEKPSGTAGVAVGPFLAWMQAAGRVKTWEQIPMTTDWDSTIRQAIYDWDGCVVALELTQRAYNQALNPTPWAFQSGDTPDPALGHAVACVSYSTNIGLVTWGQMKEMTPEFANAYVYGVWGFTS